MKTTIIEQAKKVSKYFKNKHIDIIVSSPLDRCKKTSQIISTSAPFLLLIQKAIGILMADLLCNIHLPS